MKSTYTPIVLFVMAMAVPLLFQNCGGGGQRDPSSLSSLGDPDEARKILQTNCAGCHDGPSALAEPKQILDDQYLILNRWVVPGDPFSSPVYTALFQGMPKGQAPLAQNDVTEIENWIRSLQAPVGSPANLIANGNAELNFGTVTTGQTLDQIVTIRNEGGDLANSITVRGMSAPFDFKGGVFPGTDGTCLPVLPALASCTMVIRFSPSSPSVSERTISLDYSDAAGLKTVSLKMRGTGAGQSLASLSLSDTPSYTFPPTTVGAVSDRAFTVTNSGSATAVSLAVSGVVAPFSIKANACGTSLMPGATCKITLSFTPAAGGTTSTMKLNVAYNTGAGAASVSTDVAGAGLTTGTTAVYYSQVRAILSLSKNCGGCHDSDWGTTRAQLLQFKKSGSTPAIASAPNSATSRMITRLNGVSGLGEQMGVGGSEGKGSLDAADRAKIIQWIMDGAPDDPVGARANLTLSGATPVSFGSVVSGATNDVTLTIQNTGIQAATAVSGAGLVAPFSFKGGTFPGTGGSCGTTIASAAACTIVVRYSPAAAGSHAGTIQILYNDGSAVQTLSRAVSGSATGVSLAALSVSPSSHGFGTILVSQAGNAIITVKNDGQAQATSIAVSGLGAPFKYTGGGAYPGSTGTCGATLAAGATCKLALTFQPSAAGASGATLNLAYNNGATAKSVSISLAGTGLASSTETVYYSQVQAILSAGNCYSCHTDMGPGMSNLLDFQYEGRTGNAIVAGNYSSRFIQAITTGVDGNPAKKMGVTHGELGEADVAALIGWIMNGTPADPPGTVTQSFRPLLGDRYYIGSVLYKVFGTSTSASDLIDDVTGRLDLFGSPCHPQDSVYINETVNANRRVLVPFAENCGNDRTENALEASVTPDSSVVSESLRITTCMKLSVSNGLLDKALTGAGLTAGSAFDKDSIEKLFHRFYASQAPSASQSSALITIGEKSLTAPNIKPNTPAGRRREGWRIILMSICSSSGWTAP